MKILPVKRDLEKTNTFSKDVKKLPQNIVEAGWKISQILQSNIFAPQLDIRKLEGYNDIWRVVVKKDYRRVYSFDEANIYLLRFAHRKDIYRLNIAWD
ncbi:MAG: type II toxin-antitoxin system RelE family toxin [bacterium]